MPISDSSNKHPHKESSANKESLDKNSLDKKKLDKSLKRKKTARKSVEKENIPNATDAPITPHPIFIEVSQRCLVSTNQLKRYSKPSLLPADTRSAPDLDIGFGQQRALKALHTALDIHASGYHVFAAGENGLGKRM